MKTIFFVLTCILISMFFINCRSNNFDKHDIVAPDSIITQSIDSVRTIDSLIWLYYASNYYQKALFYDTLTKTPIKLDPVECNVMLDRIKRINRDSSIYIFSFEKSGCLYRGTSVLKMSGFGIYDSVIYPLIYNFDPDYTHNVDSLRSYYNETDSAFKYYLKHYQGQLSPWLKNKLGKR